MTLTGLGMLKMFEVFKAEPYNDGRGFMTVGYGHLIKPGEVFSAPLTEQQAEDLLAKDVLAHEQDMMRLVSAPLVDHEHDALSSFVFNAGAGNFQTSTLRRMLNSGSPRSEIAEQFPKWVYSGGKFTYGLARRRLVEAARFLGAGPVLMNEIWERTARH